MNFFWSQPSLEECKFVGTSLVAERCITLSLLFSLSRSNCYLHLCRCSSRFRRCYYYCTASSPPLSLRCISATVVLHLRCVTAAANALLLCCRYCSVFAVTTAPSCCLCCSLDSVKSHLCFYLHKLPFVFFQFFYCIFHTYYCKILFVKK